MRKLFAALLLFVMQKNLQAQSITGTINNAARAYIIFKGADKYGISSTTDTVKLGKDGSFRYSVKLNSPNINASLEVAPKRNIPVWLTGDKSLFIEIKDSSSKPNFSGELARINQYLQEENPYEISIYTAYKQRNPNFADYASAKSAKYFEILDSLTSDQLLFLRQSFQDPRNKYEQKFVAQKAKDLTFKNLFYKISYNNPPLEKLIYYQKNFNVTSPTSFNYSDEIDFNTPDFLSPALLRFSRMFFMELVFRYQKSANIKLSKEAFYEKFFSEVNRLSKNKVCNAVLKASFIKDELNFMSLNQNTTEATYSRFIDSLRSYSQIKQEAMFIEGLFQKKISDFYARRSGEPAPACHLTDSSGNVFTLDNFKGKLLYIDVWATWCKPCIESIPHWNKLVEQYKNNKDIVFITVSTDELKEKTKWVQMLGKYKFKGLHYISTGGTESEFAKKFNVISYPTNILIDKEGRIIQIKAERPETINLLRYL